MKKAIISLLVLLVGAVLIAGWFFLYACEDDWCRIFPVSLRPIFGPAPIDVGDVIPRTPTVPSGSTDAPRPPADNATPYPLTLPDGFRISIFAKDLPGVRVLRFDGFGNLWVSQTGEGKISMIEIDRETGNAVRSGAVLRNLNNPHGLAFPPENTDLGLGFALYYAEEHRVSRIATYSDQTEPDRILELPSGGGHNTRTLGFGPDGNLYISVGSSCNVCREDDERRAAIVQYDPETKRSRVYAKGLRNTVFFIWDSIGRMWGTDMGRDLLGDDVPPDEINLITDGKNYGWPICYGKNIHDDHFDKNTYIRNPCMEPFEMESFIDLQAHSAPLGLAFVPEDSNWPGEYKGSLLVSYHGSWNRSKPTGYKVVRHKFDASGSYLGTEDFITGWLQSNGDALGRPVDIVFHKGAMYLSDDKAGVIYKIEYLGE